MWVRDILSINKKKNNPDSANVQIRLTFKYTLLTSLPYCPQKYIYLSFLCS